MENDEKQPFLIHLEELRKRLIACAIAVGVGFVIAYTFSERLFQVLILPLKEIMPEGDRLIFTNLPEMFFTYLKTGFVAGILLVAPFIFYQLWLFIAPGLYQQEKRYLVPFVIFSTILFFGGAFFGYFIVFPFGFKFFIGFANENIQALPSVKQYFSFSSKLLCYARFPETKTEICHFINLCGGCHIDAARCNYAVNDGRTIDHFI